MNHDVNTYFLDTFDNYRPQRSWAKVMFLQASVILSTGGVSVAGRPPRRQTPQDQTLTPGTRPPGTRHTPLEAEPPPGTRHPPREADPLPRKQTPAYGQRAAGTHPTEMHSC